MVNSLGNTCVNSLISKFLFTEASLARRNQSIHAAVTLTQNLVSGRDISRAMRSPFEPKDDIDFELTVPDFEADSMSSAYARQQDDARCEEGSASMEVRIERTVRLGRRDNAYELENYTRSFGSQSQPLPRPH